jgi:hypothetical protein
MKMAIAAIALALFSVGASAQEQDKPRVFVAGRGTQNAVTNATVQGSRWFRSGHAETNIDAHDESMEVTKDLQKCSGVVVSMNEAASDYTVMLDRESKKKRGLLRSNSQVQVVNRAGDVIGSTATRTVNNASKDACNTILSDWAKHGRIAAPQVEPTAPAQPVLPVTKATPAPVAKETPQDVVVSVKEESLGEIARRARQHTACLKLAADNPSITCN